MPIGSYRFRASSTRAMPTTRNAAGSQRRLEIRQLHDLSTFGGCIRGQDQLQHVHALDLGVQWSPSLAQAGDEVDNLERIRVRCDLTHVLDDNLLAAARDRKSTRLNSSHTVIS